MTSSSGWRRLVSVVVFAMVASTAVQHANPSQDAAPVSAIKAAFLFNFVKFIEWPAGAQAETDIVMCVVDDKGVADALDGLVKGRSVEGRRPLVRRLEFNGPVRECHLLYVSGIDRERSVGLLKRLNNAPVFSVSDFDRFAPLGGVAHFFLDGTRMRFAINPDAAQRSGIRISSQVLGLAKIVKESNAF